MPECQINRPGLGEASRILTSDPPNLHGTGTFAGMIHDRRQSVRDEGIGVFSRRRRLPFACPYFRPISSHEETGCPSFRTVIGLTPFLVPFSVLELPTNSGLRRTQPKRSLRTAFAETHVPAFHRTCPPQVGRYPCIASRTSRVGWLPLRLPQLAASRPYCSKELSRKYFVAADVCCRTKHNLPTLRTSPPQSSSHLRSSVEQRIQPR